MLNERENMIIIDGQVKTARIHSCQCGKNGSGYDIVYRTNPSKVFSYGRHRVVWLRDPVLFDPQQCCVYHKGYKLNLLSFIAVFSCGYEKYWYVEYANGAHSSYLGSEITWVHSCLEDKQSKDVFAYLTNVAAVDSLQADDGTPLLLKQYRSIGFLSEDRAIAPYLNPERFGVREMVAPSLIYPFGCNASQQRAVQAAFGHQISIIQGPPGTGKTQTILNIVANLIAQGKTVLVVSNNNSAIANVEEKLEKYGMGFITALLGSRENKDAFLAMQETKKRIPADMDSWHSEKADAADFFKGIDSQAKALQDIFARQERLALVQQELSALEVERIHFEKENVFSSAIFLRGQLSSKQLMAFWNELQLYAEHEQMQKSWFSRVIYAMKAYLLKRKIRRFFGGVGPRASQQNILELISVIQYNFYRSRHDELTDEMEKLKNTLAVQDAKRMREQLQADSMSYLRNVLYHRFGEKHERPVFRCFTEKFIEEFPVILSTTFSSRLNFQSDVVFDYVIMDEASQVSVETGALALMCARNAVIVGDSKQLPNVITGEDRLKLQSIGIKWSIDSRYNCLENSFLQSMCLVLPAVSQTLLREHYRCHPKIIGFCNQKFYGGRLIIMTEDKGEADVISAKRTVAGNHSRGKMNPREIEVITREVIPTLQCEMNEIGVIAPYNSQVDALNKLLGEHIDVATVHKFQGREKDAIVLSTVDDTITKFSDDANLLNVAISRAKRQFCLVVSGNDQPKDCNISDLLAYIEYNNCTVSDSKICSVFDLLYKQYAEARMAFLKNHQRISEYDSENLTYALLEDMITDNPDFAHLGIVCHQPLRQLLRDFSLLGEENRRYVFNAATHLDFLLYNRVGKQPVLAIETDGYEFHKEGTEQSERDQRKNRILALYGIPLLRLSTVGTDERKRIENKLSEIGSITSQKSGRE